MYFWNTKALAHELSTDTLDKKHYKNYYLMGAVLISAVYYLGMYAPYSDLSVTIVECVATLLIMGFGIQKTYQANGGDEGENFLNRITALSFPIFVQITVFGVLFAGSVLAALIIFELEGTMLDLWYEWVLSAFTLFLQIMFFVRLNMYMKRVAEHSI